MTPFEALYDFKLPRLISYIPRTSNNAKVDQQLKSSDAIWGPLFRDSLHIAQNRIKKNYK